MINFKDFNLVKVEAQENQKDFLGPEYYQADIVNLSRYEVF